MAEIFKTSSKSNPNQLAGAIAGTLRFNSSVEIQAVGAAAINQTVKAVAIARGFLIPSGIDLNCLPSFQDVVINGDKKTAIRFLLERK